jgi:hypothetical protein
MGLFERAAAWARGRSPTAAGPGASPTSRPGGPRVSGEPPSANGASSFHLFWELPGEFVAAEVTLEVTEPPTVPRLYFWALQVDFVEAGRAAGGAHLGLQHHPDYPGRTAVNWGGYDPSGRVLAGTASRLAGSLGNPHTRDLRWRPGHPYRLRVGLAPAEEQPGDGRTAWRGQIVDLTDGSEVTVRDLLPRGTRLVRPMVWSEVFARCEHPAVEVHWSDPAALSAEGRWARPTAARVNYQRPADGGCANTCSWVDGGVLVQRTNADRRTPQDARLVIAAPA